MQVEGKDGLGVIINIEYPYIYFHSNRNYRLNLEQMEFQ